MSDNPFKILGFAPNAFRGIKSDHDIADIVKALYRAKSRFLHPDAPGGGDETEFKKLANAAEQLEYDSNQGLFEFWREEFLKTRKGPVAKLEEDLSQRKEQVQMLENCLLDFWQALINIGSNSLSTLSLKPMCLLMMDALKTELLYRFESADHWGNNVQMFDLEIASDGSLTRFPLQKIEFDSKKQEPPKLPQDWIFISNSKGDHSYYFKRADKKEEPLEGIKLIGSVDGEKFKNFKKVDPNQGHYAALLPFDSEPKKNFQAISEGFSWEEFQPYIILMSPNITPDSLLVGLKITNEKVRFFILGKVRGIQF